MKQEYAASKVGNFLMVLAVINICGQAGTGDAAENSEISMCSSKQGLKIGDIADENVVRFFENNPDGRLQVVVVLKAGQPKIMFSDDGVPLGMDKTAQLSNEAAYEDTKSEMTGLLTALGIEQVNWLDNAQSFVVSISANEMNSLCKSNLIDEIVSNELLKRQ